MGCKASIFVNVVALHKRMSENMGNRYVYLDELDSVRTSIEDQVLAEKVLYREVFVEGNIVVLSYNQIVDGIAFMHILEDEKVYRCVLKLFKFKRLLVNQYKAQMSISQYVQDNFIKKSFIPTYLSFLNQYRFEVKRKIMKAIVRCMKYSNAEYFDRELQLMVLSKQIEESDREKLNQYVRFLLSIDRYIYKYHCYLPADNSLDQLYPSLLESMEAIMPFIKDREDLIGYWKELTRYLRKQGKDARSNCYHYIEKLNCNLFVECTLKELCDLAYNWRVRSSIPNCEIEKKIEEDVDRAWARAVTRYKCYGKKTMPAPVKKTFWNKWVRSTGVASAVTSRLGRVSHWWPLAIMCATIIDTFRVCGIFVLLGLSQFLTDPVKMALTQWFAAGAVLVVMLYIFNKIVDSITERIYLYFPYSQVVPVNGNPFWPFVDLAFLVMICGNRLKKIGKVILRNG